MRFNKSKSKGNIVTDGLVLYLDAGIKGSYPGSGTTWTDLAGSNDGTLTNGPTFSSGNGGSIDFDGSNDVVNVADNASLRLTSAMTLEVIWKGQSSSTNAAGVGKFGSSGQRGYMLAVNNAGRVVFFVASNSTTFFSVGVDSVNNPAVWSHYCGVYTPSTSLVLYKDGSQIGINTTGIPASQYSNNGLPFQVGGRGDAVPGLDYFFDGNIAIARIYNRALSATEVTQNFEANRNRFGI